MTPLTVTDTTVAAGTAAKEVIRITFEVNFTDIDDVETSGLRLLNDKVGVGVLPSKSYFFVNKRVIRIIKDYYSRCYV